MLFLLACSPDVPLSDIQVASADLDGIALGTAAVIGGGGWGSATLNVTDTDGRGHAFPIRLRAGQVGAVVEVDRTLDFGTWAALDLPDEPLTADQLLGNYRGTRGSLVIGGGVTGMDLENRHGVVLDKEMMAVGVSIFAGYQQIGLSLGTEYGETYEWSEFVVDDTGWEPEDTGDTGSIDTSPPIDTSSPDTDAPNDTAPPTETPDPPDCSDCGLGICGCSGSSAGLILPLGVLLMLLRRRGPT